MAEVRGSVIGHLSGKLGNLAARITNGRTIMSARPASFNASNSQASLTIRQKFAATVEFAKSVFSLAVLEKVWSIVKTSGISVFNTIFSKNFKNVSTDRPTDKNIITPGGFNISVQNPAVGAAGVTADIDALDSKAIFTAEEVDLTVAALVCYYNPTDPEDLPYQLLALNKEIAGFDFTSVYALDLPYDVVQAQIRQCIRIAFST